MQVLLANPRGFCAGVDRAIEIVERALVLHGAPIYVRHEVVHNKFVVDDLRAKGAVFVEELAEVPAGSTVVFSAHGVSQAVRREAESRGLKVFDATCPLVTKVHVEVAKMREQGREIVMIGHRGHPEVEGTMGQSEGGMHLVERPDDVKKDDICYATQNRQDAIKTLARRCDVVIVVGSPNSSNSNRLREVAEQLGVPAYMVDNAEELRPEWVAGKSCVGITAGASAPEILVQAVVERLRGLGADAVGTLDGIAENVTFPLPKGLTAT